MSTVQHETPLSIVREYRGMGDSWPKAIRSMIGFRSRIGWSVVKLGRVISRTGAKIVPGGI